VAAGIAPGPSRRTFRRSLALRATSLLALLLFGAAAAARAASGTGGTALAVTVTLALSALVGAVSAWGDRFTLDPEGIAYRNVFLGRMWARHIAWRDVVRVQAHHRAGVAMANDAGGSAGAGGAIPRALFIVPRDGPRLALDAIEDFEDLRWRVARGCAAAGSVAAAGGSVSTPPGDRPR
jgi:hypothetical protein